MNLQTSNFRDVMRKYKTRVLIVDDSAVVRQVLRNILDSDPEIEFMDVAGSVKLNLLILYI